MPAKSAKAPFGSTVPNRFSTKGLYHTFNPERNKVAPNQYNLRSKLCVKKDTLNIWKRQQESEEYAKHFNYRQNFQILVEQKKDAEERGGPGSFNVRTQKCTKSTTPMERGFSNTTRTDFSAKNRNPGPGTYDKGIFQRSSVIKKRYGVTPSFEWDGFSDRFALPKDKKKSLPPNTYTPKDPRSMDALLNRVISINGPYKLFTGPRDATTIHNHFTAGQMESADAFYDLKGDLDYLLKHPAKRSCGVFNKTSRTPDKKPLCGREHQHMAECYINRRAISPEPATYNIDQHTIKKAPKTKYPFNSHHTIKLHSVPRWIYPGPGRYFVKNLPYSIKPRRKRPVSVKKLKWQI